MLHKLMWWWIKGSAIFVIFMILVMLSGSQPLVTSMNSSFMNWAASFGIAITPFGAIGGYFALWMFALLFDLILSFIGIESRPVSRLAKWTPAQETGLHFDGKGNYAGKTTQDDLHFDEKGNYAGKTEKDGMHFDEKGNYAGKTTVDGLHFDEKGNYAGKTTNDNLHFDEKGNYKGKTR